MKLSDMATPYVSRNDLEQSRLVKELEMDARRMNFDEGRGTFNNFLIRSDSIKGKQSLKTLTGLSKSFGIAIRGLNDRAKALSVDINMVNVVTAKYNSALKRIEIARRKI